MGTPHPTQTVQQSKQNIDLSWVVILEYMSVVIQLPSVHEELYSASPRFRFSQHNEYEVYLYCFILCDCCDIESKISAGEWLGRQQI